MLGMEVFAAALMMRCHVRVGLQYGSHDRHGAATRMSRLDLCFAEPVGCASLCLSIAPVLLACCT